MNFRTAAREAQSPRLIGRQAEFDRLGACLARARRGSPMALLFEGEPGSGKTSLLSAIHSSPLIMGRNLIAVRVHAAQDVDVVARAVESFTRPELFKSLGGRRRASEVFRKLLPEWLSTLPLLGNLLSAILVTGQAVNKRRKPSERSKSLAEDIATLHQLAQRRAIAIMVDDLQQLSPAAADRLLRLLRTAHAGTRLLVVATVATPAPGVAPSIARVLQDGLPPDRVVRHQLSPFTPAELDEWLDDRYSADIPQEVSNFLLAETGGQPAAILTLLERLLATGAMRRDEHGWKYDATLAETQLDAGETADAYLTGLSEQTAALLRAGSVFGNEFDAGELARLVNMDELDLEDRLAVAVRRGLLVVAGETAHGSGEISTRYRFSSATGRAALQRSLSLANRRALEARLGAHADSLDVERG